MSNGEHVQIYLYKLPKKKHDPMVQFLKKFTGLYKKYGTQSWEFYQLGVTEPFEGSTSIGQTVSVAPDEELWVEVDHYKDRKARDAAVNAIMQDPTAGALFGEMAGILSPGYSLIMGEFSPVKP
jgi:uncharacterized protein YbaA (DUF1428 family)